MWLVAIVLDTAAVKGVANWNIVTRVVVKERCKSGYDVFTGEAGKIVWE